LQEFLERAVQTVVLFGFVVGAVAAYQMYAFLSEWREHMHSRGVSESHLATLTPSAVFSRNLPEQCKTQRRKLLLAIAGFFGLWAADLLLLLA
jgi:hypothetical protein